MAKYFSTNFFPDNATFQKFEFVKFILNWTCRENHLFYTSAMCSNQMNMLVGDLKGSVQWRLEMETITWSPCNDYL